MICNSCHPICCEEKLMALTNRIKFAEQIRSVDFQYLAACLALSLKAQRPQSPLGRTLMRKESSLDAGAPASRGQQKASCTGKREPVSIQKLYNKLILIILLIYIE